MSLLNPPASIGIGLATAALANSIFSNGLPPIADIRVADAQNRDIRASNKAAFYQSAGVVGVVSLLAKDPTIFVIGGAVTLALYAWHTHANLVSPETGRASLTMIKTPAETQEEIPGGYGYADDYAGGVG